MKKVIFILMIIILAACKNKKDALESFELESECENSCTIVASENEFEKAVIDQNIQCICLKSGTYSKSITLNNSKTVIGENKEKTIISTKQENSVTINSDNTTLKNLTVNSESTTISASEVKNIKLINISVTSSGKNAISIENVDLFIVHDGIILQEGFIVHDGIVTEDAAGISASDSSNIEINGDKSIIQSEGGKAISVVRVDGFIVHDGIIINGFIVHDGLTVNENLIISSGLYAVDSKNIEIENSVFENIGVESSYKTHAYCLYSENSEINLKNSSFNGKKSPNSRAVYSIDSILSAENSNISQFRYDSVYAENSSINWEKGIISDTETFYGAFFINNSNFIGKDLSINNISELENDARGGYGIIVKGDKSSIDIINSSIENCSSVSILFLDNSTGTISSTDILNSGKTGIWIQDTNLSEENKIIIDNTTIESSYLSGIQALDSSGITVKNSSIKNILPIELSFENLGDGLIIYSDNLINSTPIISVENTIFENSYRAAIIFDGKNSNDQVLNGISLVDIEINAEIFNNKYGLVFQNGIEPDEIRKNIIEPQELENNDLSLDKVLKIKTEKESGI